MPDGPLRLFVAVPVPPEALGACRALVDRVRLGPAGAGARWVRTENLHLTLRFLGPTPADRASAVSDAVGRAAAGAPTFDVTLAGAGAFPAGRRPRALWLGIAEGVDSLAALAGSLGPPLAAAGWPPDDRPFRPHLTVARTDAAPGTIGSDAARALEDAARDWSVTFLADRVVLYRSHLGGGPPRYEPLLEVPLGETG